MTKSNDTSQGDLVRARRRGNQALWISILSGAAAIAVLVVVLLTVYNTEQKFTAGAQTLAGLEAGIMRLREERTTLSSQIEQLKRETTETLAMADVARPAAAALAHDAAARDAAIEGMNKAEAERRKIEEQKSELAIEVEKLRKERDELSDTIETLAGSLDADTSAAAVMREGRNAAEAAIADAQKRQAEARDRAKMAEEDARTMREKADIRRADFARISGEIQSSQLALADQQNRIAKVNEQRSKLATDIQEQQNLLTKLRDQAAADAAHVQRLRNEIETLADSRNRLSTDTVNLKGALSWLEPRVVELGALQARSGEIRDAYVKARQEQRAQELELDDSRAEAVTLQQQVASRREILADLATRETEARDVLSSAQAQAKVAKEAQEKLRNELKAAEADLTELQRQRDATQAERSMVSANVAELTVSRDTLQKKVAELQVQIDQLESTNRQARSAAESRVE